MNGLMRIVAIFSCFSALADGSPLGECGDGARELARNGQGFLEFRFSSEQGHSKHPQFPSSVSNVNAQTVEREILHPVLLANSRYFFGVDKLPGEIEFSLLSEFSTEKNNERVKMIFTVAVSGFPIEDSYVRISMNRITGKIDEFVCQLASPETIPKIEHEPYEALRRIKERAELDVHRLLSPATNLWSGAYEGSLRDVRFSYNTKLGQWQLVHSILVEETDRRTIRYRVLIDVQSGEFVGIHPATHPGDRWYGED